MDQLKQRRYEAVLCDLERAGMDGMDLLRGVREGHPEVAVVVIIEPHEIRRGILAMIDGAAGYIVRTQPSETFFETVRASVERHRIDRILAGHCAPPKRETIATRSRRNWERNKLSEHGLSLGRQCAAFTHHWETLPQAWESFLAAEIELVSLKDKIISRCMSKTAQRLRLWKNKVTWKRWR
jgi:DNA-binding response OmpR family regulator